jgi:hypothetical protein
MKEKGKVKAVFGYLRANTGRLNYKSPKKGAHR